MKRYSRRAAPVFIEDEGEDKLYERQALISESRLEDDYESSSYNDEYRPNLASIRQRQTSSKNKQISRNTSLNNNIDNHSEQHELKKFDAHKSSENEPNGEFTHYAIQPGDTLQNICLRYACPINQVKRLNGLMTDQEFYGLRHLKLPLGKLGLLEDVLRSNRGISAQNGPAEPPKDISYESRVDNQRYRFVNSPGSALSVSTNHNFRFKPLLSPGYSSDRINEMNSYSAIDEDFLNARTLQNHSHSFSSLRDLVNSDGNANSTTGFQLCIDTKALKEQSFIKTQVNQECLIDAEDIGAVCQDNVEKVFQDLDLHVERAKIAAETYDKRATDLVDKITTNGTSVNHIQFDYQPRVSKIPQLFLCNENFGLNQVKLFAFIMIVCLLLPLIYIISREKIV